MREHLFRGFHPDGNGTTEITLNGEKIKGDWVEGAYDLHKETSKGFIISIGIDSKGVIAYTQEVLPETVCEYTGLTDKNGKKIFEDDIVEAERYKEVVRFEDGCFHPMGAYYARRLGSEKIYTSTLSTFITADTKEEAERRLAELKGE